MEAILYIGFVLYATLVVYFGLKIVAMKDSPVESLKYFVDILFSRGNWLTNIIAASVCVILFPLFVLIPLVGGVMKIMDGIMWIWTWWVNRTYY